MVRIKGLEPPRRRHQNLNLARLPIPPYPPVTTEDTAAVATVATAVRVLPERVSVLWIAHHATTAPVNSITEQIGASISIFSLMEAF